MEALGEGGEEASEEIGKGRYWRFMDLGAFGGSLGEVCTTSRVRNDTFQANYSKIGHTHSPAHSYTNGLG